MKLSAGRQNTRIRTGRRIWKWGLVVCRRLCYVTLNVGPFWVDLTWGER